MLKNFIKQLEKRLRAQSQCVDDASTLPVADQLDVLALEDRILYSAVPMVDVEAPVETVDIDHLFATEGKPSVDQNVDQPNTPLLSDTSDEDVSALDLSEIDPQNPLQVVFVDAAVVDSQSLVDDLLQNSDGDDQWIVVRLTDDSDGLSQITSTLEQLSGVDAVHIVSHGDGSGIQLGNTRLDSNSLAGYAGEVSQWSDALDADADLLIYGCDLASTSEGQTLIDAIAALCDCDVAASDDVTGHADLGGDWEFEYLVGSIEANVAFSQEVQDNWYFTLDITSNLVGHYEFEENGGGTLTDSAGNQNGSFGNGASWTTDEAVGDYALDFSGDGVGSNAYVEVADNAAQDFGSGDWTVAFWYNLSGTPSSNVRLVGDFDGGGAGSGFLVFADSSGDINLQLEDTGATSAVDWVSGTFNGTWQHVALSFDSAGNTVTWYVNGSQVNTSSFTGGSINTTDLLRIGASSNSVGDYEGKLDDVRLYTRTLSSGDVGELYALTSDGWSISGDTLATEGSNATYTVSFDGTIADSVDLTLTDIDTTSGDYGNFVSAVNTAVAGRSDLSFDGTTLSFTPGSSDYSLDYDNSASNFNDISGTGTALGLTDDGSTLQTIGFDFDFYGSTYSQLYVNDNGYLTFGGTVAEYNIQDFSAGQTIGNLPAIAPMWADFNHGSVHTDDAYIQTIGAAGSRELIVQYNDVVFYDYDNAGATVTLQVVLFEGSNDIEFRYQDVVAGGAYQNGVASTIGISDGAGDYQQHSFNSASIVSGSNIHITAPGSGTMDDLVITLGITDDGLVESDEDFAVALSNSVNTSVLTSGVTTTIQAPVTTVTVTTATDNNDAGIVSGNSAHTLAWLSSNRGADGLISLREAITAANNQVGADTIDFNIAGTGAHTINLSSALPNITDEVTIDATTDDSFAANGNAPAIIIDGNNLVGSGFIFESSADNSLIEGLVIRDFAGNGITLYGGADNITIRGNYLGSLTTSGTDAGDAEENTGYGIYVGGSNATIGGTTATTRNVIAGNYAGVVIDGAGATNNWVFGNFIGVAADGSTVIGHANDGIYVTGSSSNTIGTNLDASDDANEGNIIAGSGNNDLALWDADSNFIRGNSIGVDATATIAIANGFQGIWVGGASSSNVIGGTSSDASNIVGGSTYAGIEFNGAGTSNNIVQGNFIGTNASGTLDLGNGTMGVFLTNEASNNTIGGIGAGEGNVIAFSADDGVAVNDSGTNTTIGNTIRGNSIYGSGDLGIDIGTNGRTSNDAGDVDNGANRLQNWAVLSSATIADDGTFSFDLDTSTLQNRAYYVDFYASTDRDGGQVEGARYLGTWSGITDGSVESDTLSGITLNPGEYITTVTTDVLNADSSEFSNYAVVIDADGDAAPTDLIATTTTEGGLSINQDGGNDIFLIADDGGDLLGSLTSLTYETRYSTTDSSNQALISYATASHDNEFKLVTQSDGDLLIQIGSQSTTDNSFDFRTLADGQEHTVSFTWQSSDGAWSLYIDGSVEASGTLSALHTIDAGGALVIGNEQDSVGGSFDPNPHHSATIYDARLFSGVRSANEIAASYRGILPHNEPNLVANWRFDAISSDGVVVDTVSGNNLTVRHATEPGFTASEAMLTFSIDENVLDETVVGTVVALDSEREAKIASLLAADSDLRHNAETGKFYKLVSADITWADANTNALATDLEGISGQLGTIRGAAEQELFTGFYSELGDQILLGATDTTVEGEFRWHEAGADADQFWQGDGTGYAVGGAYTNWHQSWNPDNAPANSDPTGEDYIAIWGADGKWNDVYTAYTASYVVEWDADAVLDATDALTYVISAQSHAGAFTIDADTGVISVLDGSLIDYEDPTPYTATVEVTDSNLPTGNTYTEQFSITVNDLLEANNAPTDLSSGIELNTDGGNDAYFVAADGGAVLGGLAEFTFETSFVVEAGAQPTFLSYASSSATNEANLYVNSGGVLSLHVNGGYRTTSVTLADLADGERHSLALSWDNTNGDWAVYLDGETVDTGTGLATGALLDAGGTLVFGQEQDSLGGGFENAETFKGTLHDVRIWNEVRSAAEIELNHLQKLSIANKAEADAIGLVANWQMDGLTGVANNEVVDVVDGNNLGLVHAFDGTNLTNWSNADTGVSIAGSTITFEDDGAATGWASQVNSATLSTLGFTDDYTLSFDVPAIAGIGSSGMQAYTIGLGTTESGAGQGDVEYAMYFDSSWSTGVRVRILGADTNYAIGYSEGDTLSFHVTGTDLHFQHNGVTFHTVNGLTGSEDWYVDSSFYANSSGSYSAQNTYSVSNFRVFDGNTETSGEFSASTPVEDLHISENASNGTTVGFVAPHVPHIHNDIVEDGSFTHAGVTGYQNVPNGQLVGGTGGSWTVIDGNVDLEGAWADSPLGGTALGLDGTVPGTIQQTLATEIGVQYQVNFALTGNFQGSDTLFDLRVSAGGESNDFTTKEPVGWTTTNLLWENHSFTFTAASENTDLRFASLSTSGALGAVIGDIQVIEIPVAVTTILNDNPTLSYDAARGKFYKVVTSPTDWSTAQSNASADQINGVSGNLATIRSETENQFLRNLLQENSVSGAWLGGSDSASEDDWVWHDGSGDAFYDSLGALPGVYENFGALEPGGGATENHAELVAVNGDWNDLDGSSSRAYIVEWDASEVLSGFTFSLTDPSNNFEIDSNTGEITVAASNTLDYETATSHDVDVTVTDAAGNSYTELSMTIDVDDGFELGQSVPGAQVTFEDTPLAFTGPNAITVTDGLASADTRLQVHITTNFNGTLTLSQTTGLTIGGGSNGGTFMSIQGTESDINAAFDGMTFTPANGYTGPVTLDVTTSLGADLEGRYQFEGNANDTGLGLTQHGTFNGNATTVTDGTRGEVLSLDGTGDSVEITGMFGNPADLTLAAWVNPNLSGHEEVISLGDNVALRVQSDGSLRAFYYDSGGITFVDSDPGTVASGSWSHVALSFDDTNDQVRLYFNGQEVASTTETDSIVYGRGSNTLIGAHGFGSGAFDYDGLIDDARIYDRALSAGEIAALAAEQDTVTNSIAVTVAVGNQAPYFTSLPSAEAKTVESLSGAISVSSGDFDNDGDVDLVSTTNTGELRWHENDGTGNFSAGVVIATADDFSAVATYDVEGDGDIDIVAMNDDPTDLGDSVYVLTNNFIGSGTVSFSTTSFEGSGVTDSDGGQELAIGDIDGDGRADIAGIFYRSIGDSQVVVFEQNAVGVWTKTYSDAISNGSGIEFVDLDGDTDLDIVTGDFQTREIQWYENDGNATAGFSKQLIHDEVTSQIFDITVGDFDADGDSDIAYVTWGTTDVLVMLENDGAANPNFTRVEIDTLTGLPYHIHSADTNNDGTLDLIVADEASDAIVVYENDGNAEFTQNTIDANSRGPVWVEAADVDGDGQNDLIFAARDDNFVGLHVNQGDGNYIRGTVNEDIALGTLGVQIADDDAGAAILEVTINVTNGDIILNTASVTVLSGASSSPTITFEGTVADLNTALANLTYSPTTDFNGIGEVQITVDDRGNTGAGGAQTATESLFVEVLPQPDPLTDAYYTTWIGGSEFIVNTETNGDQVEPEITALANGEFVVSWKSVGQDGDSGGIYFQRYDAAGNAVGSETRVNSTTADNQGDATVTALDSGEFVFVWESNLQDGDSYGVFTRGFDADGVAISGELQINTTTADNQSDPEFATLPSGGFVVVWESTGQDGDGEGIYFQRYDNAGAPVGGETLVNTATTGDQSDPKITVLSSGEFVIVWEDRNTLDTHFQRFSSTGAPQGSATTLNTTTLGDQNDPEVMALTGGGFVAVWESENQDGDGNGLYGQRFDATGAAVGAEFQVNSTVTDNQQDPKITALDDGGFIVFWESNGDQDGNNSGTYSQQFDAAGNKVNGEFQINSTTVGNQSNPAVTILNDGRLVAVWETDLQDGDSNGIAGRLITPALNENSPVGTVAAIVSQVVDPDVGDVYTYSLTDDAGGAFDIQSDGTIVVLDPSLIDFENNSTMTVTVRITDPVTGFHDEIVTINLNNLAEAEHTVSGAQSVAEDGTLTFSTGNGNAVTVTDTLAGSDAPMQVTLSVDNGVLNLSGLTGITVVEGADGSGSITFNGTESAINTALEGMTFTPGHNFNGAVTLNVTTALAADLAGHYTFEGNADDVAAGTDEDGALVNGASIFNDPTRGDVLSLNNANQYVEIPGMFGNPADVTLAAWVNVNSGTFADEIISLGDNVALRSVDGANGLTFIIRGTAGWETFTTGVNISDAGWTHVAATLNDTTGAVSVYINGELAATGTATESIQYTQGTNTRIGENGNGLTHPMDGLIDDARVYTRALSAEEIAAMATDSAETTDSVAITVDAVNDAPTFELPGELVFTVGDSGYNQNQDSVVLSDGSMLMTPYEAGSGNSILVKLNADGSVDTSFGTNGYADNSSIGYIQSVTEQPDGKILVSGSDGASIFVARYNADGSVDLGFGSSGVATPSGGSFAEATDIAIQSDGSIVVVGEHGDDSVITRFTSTGTHDTTFGTSGTVVVNLGGTFENLESVTLLSDDSIIAVGETSVVKMDSDGNLDGSFGTGGILDLGDNVFGVTVQSDNKFVVTGGDGTNLFVTRFNTDGSIDTEFGTSGTATWSGAPASGQAIVQQSDGKLVAAGHTDAYPTQWVAVRFNTDGSVDSSFGATGALLMTISTDFSEAHSVSLYNDGTSEKIVIGGYTTRDGFDSESFSTMIRLNHDGTLDSSLGTNTLDGNPTFVENSPSGVILDSDVTIFDEELSAADNFNSSTIHISRSGGANAEDQFSESGLLGAITEGGSAVYNGVTIGTVSTNSGGTLNITFNGNATNALVNGLLRSIAYSNSSDTPPASVDLVWSFNDGNFGPQGAGGALFESEVITVDITGANDPAVVATNTGITVAEGGSVTITTAELNEGDPDDDGVNVIYRVRTDVNGGTVMLSGTALERNDTFTQADVDAGLVSYVHAGGEDTTEAIRLAINDVGNAGETDFVILVSVTSSNDAPSAADDPVGTFDAVTDSDTVGFWRLGEGSGSTAVDATGNNDGTYSNVTLGAAGAVTGDTAGDFNGANSYVNLGNLDVAGTGLTMAAWINADTFGGGDGRIFAKSDGAGNADHTFMLSVVDVGADVFLRMRVSAGNHTELLIAQAPSLNTSQWYHVAATYDQATGEMAMFVDGQLVEFGQHSVGGAVDQDPSRDVWIGGNPAGGNYFDGRIDEALLMERALTADEIVSLADTAPPDYSVGENATLSISAINGVLQNDSDVEGDTLTVTEVNGVGASVGNQIALGSGALLTLNADGSFDYDPNGQYESLGVGQSTTDTFTYTVDDGNGGTDTATVSVLINGVNDDPSLANLAGDTLSYNEGDGAVVIEQGADALVSDIDSVDFDGGNLNVFFFSGSDSAEDVLSIRNQGTGAGQIGVSGTDVTYGGTIIGSFTGGSAGANLVITFNANANAAAASALVQNITFENTDTGNPTTGTRNVHFRVADGDGGTTVSHVAQVTVAPVNDAPVLNNTTSPTLTTITEDDANNNGMTVADVLATGAGGDPITDVDGDPEGIAIVGRSGVNGTWQYSLDGTNWSDFGNLNPSNARLLRATDYVRFNPDGTNGASNSFVFHAWDQTSGTAGQLSDTTSNGGSTAFSSDGATARITVTDVNDAPVVTAPSGSVNLTENAGITPFNLESLSDIDSIDFDSGSLTFTVTSTPNASDDTLTLSTMGGIVNITGGVNVFVSGTQVGTVSGLNTSGPLTITFNANSTPASAQTLLQAFFVQNLSDDPTPGTRTIEVVATDGDGGTSTPVTADVEFLAVNDAPTISNLDGDTLNYAEGDGEVVLEQGGNATIADVDSDDFDTGTLTVAFSGGSDPLEDILAIRNQGTGAGEVGVSGTDVTFGGVTIGSFTGGSSGTDLVVTFNASASSVGVTMVLQNITYENTDTGNATVGNRTVDFVVTDGDGGTSTTHEATVSVSGLNDAPVLDSSGTPSLTTITEDDVDNTGMTVADLLLTGAGGDPISDADGDPDGIAITTRNNGRGVWQFSIDGGTNWGNVGTVSDSSALLLRSTDLVRFNPDGNNGGVTQTIEFRAWDQTSGTAGTKVDTTTNGGTTAFSTAIETASITSTDVNDAPVLDNSGTIILNAQQEDSGPPSGSVGTIITDFISNGGNVTDVDSSSQAGIAITAADSTNGTWWYSTDDGASWSTLGVVSDSSARVLNASSITRIYFEPNADFNGTISDAITFRAWDRSIGANGSLQDASSNGGTTAFSTATETADLTINPVNDTPVANGPAFVGATENITRDLTGVGFSVSDIDSGSSDITVTLSVVDGVINASAGDSGAVIGGSSTTTVTLTGTTAEINDLLSGTSSGTLGYLNSSDTPVATTDLILTVNDGGNTGADPGLTGDLVSEQDSSTTTINITAVNDTPFVSGPPTTYNVDEQTNLTIHGTGFGVTDVDAAAGTMTATISVGEGAITIAEGNSGITVTSGNGTTSVTFTGSLTQIDNLLTGASTGTISYFNSSDTPSATTTITVLVNDGGNTGDDPGLTGGTADEEHSAVQTININALNDPPVVSAIGDQTISEDGSTGPLVFTASDAETTLTLASISATSSNQTIIPDGNLVILSTGGTGYTIEASPAPDAFGGPVTITVTVDDGTTTTSETFDVTVTSVNDPPVAVDDVYTVEEDGVLDTNGTPVHITNVSTGGPRSIDAADIDGDGDDDLLMAGFNSRVLSWVENDGSGNFTVNALTTEGGRPMYVAASDLDNDGDMDILANFTGQTNNLVWYENDGAENFTANAISTTISLMTKVADIDGDGDLDLATASSADSAVYWYENDGSENFTEHQVLSGVSNINAVEIADLDSDGDMDLVVPLYGSNQVAWYENDGSENFAQQVISFHVAPDAIDVADVNNDGFLDVFAISTVSSNREFRWYINDGAQNFTTVTTAHSVSTLYANTGFEVVDFDADGDVDVLLTGPNSDTTWYFANDGTGAYSSTLVDNTADFATTIVAADIDSDGDLDIATSQWNVPAQLRWYETLPSVLFNDSDIDGDPISAVLVTGPTDGTLSLGADGNFIYTPDADFFGTDSFTYRANDGTVDGNLATVTINVTPVDDPPTISTITNQSINEDTATGPIAFTVNDVDNAPGSLVVTATSSDQTLIPDGNITLGGSGTNRTIDLQPAADQFGGPVTITVSVFDGTTTAQTTFDVDVAPVNDAPVLDNTGTMSLTTITEDDTNNVGDLVSDIILSAGGDRITDADPGAVEGFAIVGSSTGSGTWQYSTNGGASWLDVSSVSTTNALLVRATDRIRFVPSTQDGSAEYIDVRAWDQSTDAVGDRVDVSANGAATAFSTTVQRVDLAVTAVNDAPVNSGTLPAAITVTEDILSDVDLSSIEISDPDHSGGNITITLATSTGGNLYSTGGGGIVVGGDGTSSLTLTGSQADLNNYLDAASNIQYLHSTPDQSGNNADTINVVVNDNGNTGLGGGLDQTFGTVNVNITNINDVPVATGESYTFDEDTPYSGNVLANDTDADPGDILTPILTGDVSNGTLVLLANGSFTYTPDANYFGTDEFTYQVSDGTALSAEVTVALTINAVNDAPTTAPDSVQIIVGDSVTTDALSGVLGNDSDVEGDPITAVLVTGPASGTLTLNADGSWTYVPQTNFVGTVTFTYVANDGLVDSAPETVTIDVISGGTDPGDPNDPGDDDSGTDPSDGGGNDNDDDSNDDDNDDGADDTTIAAAVEVAESFVDNVRGQNGNRKLAPEEAILLLDEIETVASSSRQPISQVALRDATYLTVTTQLFSAEELAQLNFVINNSDLQFNVQTFLDGANRREAEMQAVAGAATCLFISAATGVALWTMSGSYLASLLLSSLPAWASFDPIHIVSDPTRLDEDDDSVAEIISQEHTSMEAIR